MRKDVTSTTRQQKSILRSSYPQPVNYVNSDDDYENRVCSSMRLFSSQQLVQEETTSISSTTKKLWHKPNPNANANANAYTDNKSKKTQVAERSAFVNRHPQVSLCSILHDLQNRFIELHPLQVIKMFNRAKELIKNGENIVAKKLLTRCIELHKYDSYR